MAPRKQPSTVLHSFRDLKKAVKRKRKESSPKPPPAEKMRPLNDDELFSLAMKEVNEIEKFRKIPLYCKEPVRQAGKTSPDKEALHVLEDTVTGKRPIHLPDTQEYVEWIDKDYQRSILKSLHAGKYAVQDCLDLHGSLLEEAEEEVRAFMKNAVTKGHRCVKIIHGRGLCSPDGPVLKQALVKWLAGRYRKYVAAFVTARQCDGGLGALYVLLK